MNALNRFLARMNGWALSLVLHGGVAVLAALSVFSAQLGGSGQSGDGSSGSARASESYPTLLRSDEQVISGTVLPDVAHYTRLTPEVQPLEPVTEELPTPTIPFDVFAVGATEPQPTLPEPVLNPPSSRPSPTDARTVKLPPCGGEGEEGTSGAGGSGGGDSDGNGKGEGSGDGNATGVYTPSPAYPREAMRRKIEGSVRVELAIAADGSCSLRRIVESSGFSPLDNAVEETVKTWKYRPAEEDGRPETMTKLVRFSFKLVR